MFCENSINYFIEELSSEKAVPGGGGSSALVGANGAALVLMVINLTVNKEEYNSVKDKMLNIREEVLNLRDRLTVLIDKDAEAYKNLMKNFKLPKNTEKETKIRKNKIQEALIIAADVPLEIAKLSIKVLEYVKFVHDNGNINVISDVKVANVLLRSAAISALYSVEINVKSIKDDKKVSLYNDMIYEIKQKAILLEREILDV